MTAFESSVSLTDIAVRDTNVSSAVDEPVRAMILDMLADEAMTVAAITEDLADRGIELRENTVRHHVNELRDAGLVDVERMEERRGGTLKYYRATTIVLSYSLPEDASAEMDEMAEWMADRLAPVIDDFETEFGDEVGAIAGEMSPCEHCREQKYETFIELTVLRRAFVRAQRDR
ncbi:MAG: winged helix-turn-helix domain-containing protein [Halanaeroarchaeum sp.]